MRTFKRYTTLEYFHFEIVPSTESLGKKTSFAHPGRPHSLNRFPRGVPLWPPEAILFSDNFKRDLLYAGEMKTGFAHDAVDFIHGAGKISGKSDVPLNTYVRQQNFLRGTKNSAFGERCFSVLCRSRSGGPIYDYWPAGVRAMAPRGGRTRFNDSPSPKSPRSAINMPGLPTLLPP